MKALNFWLLNVLITCVIGCRSFSTRHQIPDTIIPTFAPHELCKSSLPTYTVEPPDILDIQGVRLVPNANYQLSGTDVVRIVVERASLDPLLPGDLLGIKAPGAPALAPIDGTFLIQSNGSISLGPTYGVIEVGGLSIDKAKANIEKKLTESLVVPKINIVLIESGTPVKGDFNIGIDGKVRLGVSFGEVQIAGMTLAAAKAQLEQHFKTYFSEPRVSIELLQSSVQQLISGEHLVGPDGNITLGIYGSLHVVGMTLEETTMAVQNRLSEFFDNPSVSVSVYAYNSRVYYLITEGAGLGDGVFRFPVTGNDTVLDALAQVNGLTRVSSTRMWIARPTPNNTYQVLPINWESLTSLAETNTNYQLLPGDRLYVAQDSLVAFDNKMAKLFGPLERIMGFSILSAETATRFSGNVLRGGGNPRGVTR